MKEGIKESMKESMKESVKESVKTHGVGYGFGVLYCLITALSAISIGEVNKEVNPVLSQLFVFLMSALWFNACSAQSLKSLYHTAWRERQHWLIVNVSTLIIWGFSFYALVYINPVLYLGLLMALMPLFTYVVNKLYGLEPWSLKNTLFSLLVLGLSLWMIGASKGHTGFSLDFMKGCAFTILASMGAAWYLVDARLMQQKTGFKSSQMLALRFLLLIGVYLIYLGCAHRADFDWKSVHALPWGSLFVLALLTSILPLYCMQVTLSRIGSLKFSFLMPLSPVLAYGILMIFTGYRDLNVLIALIVLALVLAGRSVLFGNKK